MLIGFIIANRSWRHVSWRRIAYAIAVSIAGDIACGVAVAALLGMKTGCQPSPPPAPQQPEPKRPLDCVGIPLGSEKGKATA